MKFISLIITLGIVTVLISTSFMAKYNEKILLEDTLNNNKEIAEAISISIDNYLVELSKTTRTLASAPIIKQRLIERNSQLELLDELERKEKIEELNDKWMSIDDTNNLFIQNYISNPVSEYFKKQQDLIPDWYGEIFLTNKYGELVSSTSKLTTLAHGHKYWWLASYNNGEGKVFFDDRGYDSSVDGYVLGAVVPVYDNNEIIGILKCNINILSLLDKIIKDYSQIYEDGTVKIARTGGLIVFEPGEKPLSTKVEKNLLSILDVGLRSDILKDENNNGVIVSVSSIRSTIGSSELGFGGSYESIDHILGNDGENWVVVLTSPEEIIDKKIIDLKKQFLLIGFVLIIIISLLALLFIKRTTRHIEELVDFTEEIGQGNFDRHIKIKSNDEMGKLANSFNIMVEKLNQTMASKNELTKEVTKRKKIEEELKHLSTVDELTQLYNRRAFNDYLSKFIEHSKLYNKPLSVAMIDIDYFKKINDSYGHHVGDKVLIELSSILSKNIRKNNDILSRWGGEEFIILMPNIYVKEASDFAERLRKTIEDTKFANDIYLTVSIGVSELKDTDALDDLIRRVDDAQYKAKSNGRNNVQVI